LVAVNKITPIQEIQMTTPATTTTTIPAPASTPETTAPAAAPAAEVAPPAPKLSAAILKQKQAAAAHLQAQKDLATAQAERQALAAEKAAIAQQKAEIQAWEAAFKQNPVEALKARGLSYQQLTEMEISKQVTPDFKIDQLRQELDAERTARAKAELEAQQAMVAQQERAYRADIAKHVSDKAADYPHIAALEQTDLVFDAIDEHARRTGKVMEIDEAAKLVEAYLKNEAAQLQQKLPKAKESTQANSESADKGVVDASNPSTPEATKWASILPAPRKLKGKAAPLSNAVGASISPSVVNKPKQALTVEQWVAKNRK
jgi:hypothetical protein